MLLLSLIHARTRVLEYSSDTSNLSAWALNLAVAGVAIVWVTPLYHWFFYQRQWQGLPDVWWSYLLAVFCYDFLYYWFHRISHSLRLFWNVHSVHHQAKRLTPSLGLRSSAFDFAVIWLITGPLLWLGFGTEMLIFSVAVHGLYQIILHNEWKINFGTLEWILNTPSHHRLHHAINPEYLDKNFGSIFIIWDRIFGTFAEESVEPEIGIIGVNEWSSPLKSNIFPWIESYRKLTDRATDIGGKPEVTNVVLARSAFAKIALQFLAVIVLVSSLLYFHFPALWTLSAVFSLLLVAELIPSNNERQPG